MDKELKELGYYSGTEKYHKLMFGVLATDGVKYIMENGYSWFVTDAVVNLSMQESLKGQEFIVVELKIVDKKADVIFSDGNGNTLYTQHYKDTDCVKDLKLYYTDSVLMLCGEY